MKLPDAIKWHAHNIICFVFVHRLRYKLFDKRIKPWELPLLFLKEKNTMTFFTWVKDKPQQRELRALLFTNSVWVL